MVHGMLTKEESIAPGWFIHGLRILRVSSWVVLIAGCLIMLLAGLQTAQLWYAHWIALMVIFTGGLGLFATRTREPEDCFAI
jgi:Flp pilus assembly protein protease CpaA